MSAPHEPPDATLVARAQLPLPRPYLAPRSPTENKLATIWRTVLSMDCVGVDDAYYDLGGDSLHASMIFALIHETFNVTLPMAVLASAPTIAQLAAVIDRR
ncbi:MAG: hypothetical protein NVSMB10_08850 [Steroidobacteraceae bacterium]